MNEEDLTSEELTPEELIAIDVVHKTAYQAVCDVADRELDWDMSWIGELADEITSIVCKLTGKPEMEVYPYRDR